MNKLLLFFLMFIGVVFVFFYVRQRQLIYFPSTQIPEVQQFNSADMSVVTLRTDDNLILNSWYKPAEKGQPTILFLHGNAGNIGYRMPLVRKFINTGLGVLLLEYRGFGGNKGSPTEQGLYADGRAGVNFLHSKGVTGKQMVLFGESLGTGVATKLASETSTCAVVLQSPYTSMVDLARFHYPWILVKPWDRFDSLERVSAIRVPLLILHGQLDRVVPYSHGLAMFNAAQEPKEMVTFPARGHNDLWNEPTYSQTITTFIQKYCQ